MITLTASRKSAIKKFFGQVFNCIPTLSKIKKQFKDFDFRFKLSWERLMDVLVELSNKEVEVVPVVPVAPEEETTFLTNKELSNIEFQETARFYEELMNSLNPRKKEDKKKIVNLIPELEWEDGDSLPLPDNNQELCEILKPLLSGFKLVEPTDWLCDNIRVYVNIKGEDKIVASFRFYEGNSYHKARIAIKNQGHAHCLVVLCKHIYQQYIKLMERYFPQGINTWN